MPELPASGGTILAFDFGLRRIGVASGQTLTGTAGAVTVIAHRTEPDWNAIEAIVHEWRPDAFVVGLPLDSEGNETDMSRRARAFGDELDRRFGRTVYFSDERLTSMAAREQFTAARSTGQARARDARKLDARAAQIILENWLQSQPGQDA
ncbi:MAG: Holliday junction resolvase RuvX [Xanthomonadales bacterium]|nr:Holliday junction resolvase RuvX [Xanthomonadales bacterium]